MFIVKRLFILVTFLFLGCATEREYRVIKNIDEYTAQQDIKLDGMEVSSISPHIHISPIIFILPERKKPIYSLKLKLIDDSWSFVYTDNINNSLLLNINNEIYKFYTTDDFKNSRDVGYGEIIEIVYYGAYQIGKGKVTKIDKDFFKKFSNAKKITGRVYGEKGYSDVKYKPEQLADLKRFYKEEISKLP